ncbi:MULTISPECIES: amino-acid N-acetyltransferase [unclassified Oceanispirochaeta]|uniref:amino-acid N-acetyltransferase n=1 Tax=unclassified Oceanispirochaeta TaxID=2635722 RepID=UPI000E095E89|nr:MULTISPECIES: amino-acid N-acetyltransferase [unclassified Oceanispirochaeta]MBF9018728.1 amino-acid N-acetyltransferase [Oceanispirochaeta sp. M2]NPD75162.1 amino-acid N-acetyltransferase [Oceanispirochaeta sp. M1]RDG28983.1 amino-acid N-acetyltransferase [Oceanispirochaeta sp. M1]
MDKSTLREHVDLIREVFSYNRRFKDSLFVIKIDSSIIDHPYFSILVRDLSLLHQNGIRFVIIPGAHDRINEILGQYNISYESRGGIRISSDEAINFIKMAAFDVSNKVMTQLSGYDIPSVIGNWVRARALGVIDGVDYQNTGKVDKIKTDSIQTLLKEGHIPIFPCIGWNAKGDPYNVSSDELAKVIAVEMGASKLFFITADTVLSSENCNVPSEMILTEDGRISKLSLGQTQQLLEANPDNPLMIRVESAFQACEQGVNRVHIIDGKSDGAVLKEIFSNLGIGTMIHNNTYERIRKMESKDISSVLSLMKPFIDKGILISRSRQDLTEMKKDFVVYSMDGIIHGCGALHRYSDDLAEIAALAVDRKFVHLKIGGKIVSYLLEQAQNKGLKRVFVLTTQTSDWFQNLGFETADVEDLPEEKRSQYNKDRNSRVLMYRF